MIWATGLEGGEFYLPAGGMATSTQRTKPCSIPAAPRPQSPVKVWEKAYGAEARWGERRVGAQGPPAPAMIGQRKSLGLLYECPLKFLL
jgi:hypothetical protein